MNIILLCKMNEVTAGIASYLHNRRHNVARAPGKLSSAELSDYDIGISYNYRHILKQEQIDAVKLGIINWHTGLLPDFRGANPNIWQVVHGYGGVTAHFIDAGIDTGPIIARHKLDPEPIDTGETYYKRLNDGVEKLFYDVWPAIEACGNLGIRIPSQEQPEDFFIGAHPTFRTKDVANIDDVTMSIRTIRLLAARTFPPHKGCYILTDKGRVYVRVSLEYGE